MRSIPSRLAITGKNNPNHRHGNHFRRRMKIETAYRALIERGVQDLQMRVARAQGSMKGRLQELLGALIDAVAAIPVVHLPHSRTGILIRSRDVGQCSTLVTKALELRARCVRLAQSRVAYMQKVSRSQRIDHRIDTPNYQDRRELPSRSSQRYGESLGAVLRSYGWDRKAAVLADFWARVGSTTA